MLQVKGTHHICDAILIALTEEIAKFILQWRKHVKGHENIGKTWFLIVAKTNQIIYGLIVNNLPMCLFIKMQRTGYSPQRIF